MKIYKGFCASPGLVLGQVSRLEHHVETTTVGPFKPSRELQLLTDAIRTAQDELESMADRAAPSEQAIFQFQSMMLDDERGAFLHQCGRWRRCGHESGGPALRRPAGQHEG